MSTANVQLCPSTRQIYRPDPVEDFHTSESVVLTIEEIRQQMYSCFTCGVCWLQDHVCLDCSECGGYSLQRPCPLCDGRCASVWQRDLTMSHACGKARWIGKCPLQDSDKESNTAGPPALSKDSHCRTTKLS